MKKDIGEGQKTVLSRRELVENPVKLCHDISRLSRAKARESAIGGVMSQHGARLVLSILVANDGISQRVLVEGTHLRPPTVSVILGKMAEEGIIEFYRNPDDRRQTLVHLTDYGKEVDANVVSRINEIDKIAMSGLNEDEQEMLMGLLRKMRDNILECETEQRGGCGE